MTHDAGWRTFLVEHYWPDVTADEFGAAADRVRSSADDLTRIGQPVRYLHSTLVPEDAAAFCVLSAASRDLVERVYARAGVTFERIVDAIETVPANSEK
jgi:hypothetical protein